MKKLNKKTKAHHRIKNKKAVQYTRETNAQMRSIHKHR
jgi:hypothetical protein